MVLWDKGGQAKFTPVCLLLYFACIVKGPGDRLSPKQQVWIDLLTSLHVDIELCIVQVSKAEDEFLDEREKVN